MSTKVLAPDGERLAYGPREFSRRTGLSPSAVYDGIARGELKSRRFGGRILIPASEMRRLTEVD
jgi:hypothetical protein